MPLSRRAQAACCHSQGSDPLPPSAGAEPALAGAQQCRTGAWLGVAPKHPLLLLPKACSIPTAKGQVLTAGHVQTLTPTFPN